MAKGDPQKMVKTLVLAFVILFLLTSIINFGALFGGEGEVIKSIGPELVTQGFGILIAGIAVILAWNLTKETEGRLDKKKLVTLVVVMFVLYFLYTKLLVGFFPELPSLEMAATRVQSVIMP